MCIIVTIHRKKFEFYWKRKKIFDKFIASLLYEHMMSHETPAKVIKVTKREKARYKPYPLTTVDFQKLAVTRLKMSSDEAMKHAEKLYQKGIVSYPRTETNSFPYTMNMKRILEQVADGPYQDYISNSIFKNIRYMIIIHT